MVFLLLYFFRITSRLLFAHTIQQDGSKHLKAFLGACFRKDPAERPSAEELLDYAWIKKAQYMRVLHQSASDFSNARMKRAIQQGLSDGLTGIPKTPVSTLQARKI